MFVDLPKKYHWVLPIQYYANEADLIASLGEKVIAPAEAKAKELETPLATVSKQIDSRSFVNGAQIGSRSQLTIGWG